MDVAGCVELRAGCQAAIPGEAGGAAARDGRDDTGTCGDFANALIAKVGDVKIAARIDSDP
jgi:hypothetical protein